MTSTPQPPDAPPKTGRHTFSDQPISTADQDRLHRHPFAKALSEQLSALGAGESVVFALCGPWGSGKTSILNMMQEELRSVPGMTVIRFNPWLFSGAEQLVMHFFRELAGQLSEAKDKKLQKLADALEQYGVLVGPLGSLPIVGKMVGATGALAKLMGALARHGSNALPKSAESQRRWLQEALRNIDGRIVVVIDDIDRLRSDEVRDVMRLVRLVGDFPNVHYVLAFDRERVVKVLGAEEADGQAYLEKIVQVAFDVPESANEQISTLLMDAVNEVLRDNRYPCDQHDLDNTFVQVIRPLFSTAREVRRYANALPMAFALLGDEVCAPDLLALEAMRIIHPEVVALIPQMFDTLTAVTDRMGGWRDNRDEGKRDVERILTVATRHGDVVKGFLKRVFPPTRAHLDNHTYGHDSQQRWRRERRVASPEVLRTYLLKRLPSGEVPSALVERAVKALPDTVAFTQLVQSLSAKELEELLDRMLGHTDAFPTDSLVASIHTAFSVEGRLREGREGFMDPFGADPAATRIVYQLLKRAGEAPKVVETLVAALTPGLSLSSRLKLIRYADPKFELVHDAEVVTRLQKELAQEVLAASPHALAQERRLDELILLAKQEGGGGQEWFQTLLQNDDVLLRLLRAALSEGFRMSVEDAVSKKVLRLPWKWFTDLIGEEFLKVRVLELSGKQHSGLDERTGTALRLAAAYATGNAADEE